MRGMASVQTSSTWVSPRWNRPEPCAVGSRPTSADTGRRSARPRPSMRRPSSTMRLRTSFLVSERTASLISFSWPANSPGASEVPASAAMRVALTASVAALRSCLPAIVTALARSSVATRSTAANTSSAVVDDGGELERRDRAVGGDHAGDELALQGDRLLDPHLAGLEAAGQDGLVDDLGARRRSTRSSSRCRRPRPSSRRRRRCRAHDRRRRARTCRRCPRRRSGAGSTSPPWRVGDAHGADRAVERDAADHQRRRGGVDRQHVVRAAGGRRRGRW